jgi:hypothetical protein
VKPSYGQNWRRDWDQRQLPVHFLQDLPSGRMGPQLPGFARGGLVTRIEAADRQENKRIAAEILAQHYGTKVPKRKKKAAWPEQGNLPNNDYRFWWGNVYAASQFSMCRLCGKVAQTGYQRKQHMEDSKCTVLLVRAYKLLLRDHLCVMCDERTTHEYWGVPLCKPACVEAWMYDLTHGHPGLKAALKIVERDLPDWMREKETQKP